MARLQTLVLQPELMGGECSLRIVYTSIHGTGGEIIKPMLIINFADDLINPPELLHLLTASNYTAVMFPAGPASYGHMTLAHPAVWASVLGSFLQRLPLPIPSPFKSSV